MEDLFKNYRYEKILLENIVAGKSPYNSVINTSKPINLSQTWETDAIHVVKIVDATSLNIRESASQSSQVVGSLDNNQRIIVDLSYNTNSDWHKIVYPQTGYVSKQFLLSDDKIQERIVFYNTELNDIGNVLIDYDFGQISKKEYKNFQKTGKDSIVLNNIQDYFVSNSANKNISSDSIKIWWTDKTDLDTNSINGSAILNIQVNASDYNGKLKDDLYFRNTNCKHYTLYENIKIKPNKVSALKFDNSLDKYNNGTYNLKLKLYDDKTSDFINTKSLINEPNFSSQTFEKEKPSNELLFFVTATPYAVPIDADFTKRALFFPVGINAEYNFIETKFSLGFGYNSLMKSLSSTEKFQLSTETAFFY